MIIVEVHLSNPMVIVAEHVMGELRKLVPGVDLRLASREFSVKGIPTGTVDIGIYVDVDGFSMAVNRLMFFSDFVSYYCDYGYRQVGFEDPDFVSKLVEGVRWVVDRESRGSI